MSEFKHLRTETFFRPHGSKTWVPLVSDAKIDIEETREFLDGAGRIVRTERRINGVLVEGEKT